MARPEEIVSRRNSDRLLRRSLPIETAEDYEQENDRFHGNVNTNVTNTRPKRSCTRSADVSFIHDEDETLLVKNNSSRRKIVKDSDSEADAVEEEDKFYETGKKKSSDRSRSRSNVRINRKDTRRTNTYSDESSADSGSETDSDCSVRSVRETRKKTRMRESEKLISDFEQSSKGATTKNSNRMVEEDAALAAAMSAGYYSDDERERERSRRSNPYARNMPGPTRRSGRSAAMVSAARLALYSSMLNPPETPPAAEEQNRYNLRPNRPGSSSNNDILNKYVMNESVEGPFRADGSSISRLFEDDDDDNDHVNRNNDTDRDFDDLNINRNRSNNNNNNATDPEQHFDNNSLKSLDQIAGMDGYVSKLKEMIVFPLIYPHLFEKLNISLPRGVLFHGPPGTGKTLMARLLASACSTSTRKVSFFMRNGSDCLSKWIGEAERNMRLLFKKAKDCQPSIIFFDEIDGLAPERTGRQDQSHISLVSTLLALMDGLDDRGQVVVIGATNRIHSIDAALRRPGRFDREFYFGLPDEAARAKILEIQTKSWEPPISQPLSLELATRTAGYSGADMKALCVEAALRAVQRTFPQVYESNTVVAVSTEDTEHTSTSRSASASVSVTSGDFEHALLNMIPSTRRHISKFDLITLQRPQNFFYSEQLLEFKRLFIDSNVKKGPGNSSGNMSGKWQVIEPSVIDVVFDPSVHLESFVWRFICGIGEGLDGFTVTPVDLLSEMNNSSSSSVEGIVWKLLNDSRLLNGPTCVLFKSFSGLGREGRRQVRTAFKMFMRTLIPGEPFIIIFMTRKSKKGKNNNLLNDVNVNLVDSIKSCSGGGKHFHLVEPSRGQIVKYHEFVLTSIFRLISDSYLLEFSLEHFITRSLEILMSIDQTILEMERTRMEWTDAAIREPIQLIERIMSATIKPIEKISIVKHDPEPEPEPELECGFDELKDTDPEQAQSSEEAVKLVQGEDQPTEHEPLISEEVLVPPEKCEESQENVLEQKEEIESSWTSEYDISF